MTRDDLRGRLAPRHLVRLIAGRWGRNPFGEPRYRLVWGPSRLERSGGLWRDWQPGTATTDKRTQRAWRARLEMRWVRKYGDEECWLIEAWHPAEHYGLPETWYRPQADGGTLIVTELGSICALGDYPTAGDYEDIGARMHWSPTERHIEAAIGAYERGARSFGSVLARAKHRERLAREAERETERAFDGFAKDVFDDAEPAFRGAPFAGPGVKHRPSLVGMAEKIGIRQHPY